MRRLSYSRFRFYFWFQRLYVTCLSSLSTQRTSLYTWLSWFVCLSSGFYSQEKLWTCWAGDKNDTEQIFFSAYLWRLWAPPSSLQSTMLHSCACIRIWGLEQLKKLQRYSKCYIEMIVVVAAVCLFPYRNTNAFRSVRKKNQTYVVKVWKYQETLEKPLP